MDIKFLDVTERDIDMIILEEFASSKDFANIFLDKIGLSGAEVVSVEHSKTDIELGESDITIIVKNGCMKHAVLIEDKIDAIAQPNQCQRYFARGELGIRKAEYNSFDVFIVAPEKYIKEDKEAEKYPNKVLYEDLVKYFNEKSDERSKFKLVQLEQAIQHQKSGYKVIENKKVTEFWDKYIDYQKKEYPQLALYDSKGPKGARSMWPTYKTVHKDVTIVHKTEKGSVDLSFRGGYERIHLLVRFFEESIEEFNKMDTIIETAGKSAVLRKRVPIVDVFETFEKQESAIKDAMEVVKEFNEILLNWDARKLQEILHS